MEKKKTTKETTRKRLHGRSQHISHRYPAYPQRVGKSLGVWGTDQKGQPPTAFSEVLLVI